MTGDSPAKRRSISKFRKNLEVAERDARACRLYYVERMTYREVAEALGFANEGGRRDPLTAASGRSRPKATRT